MKRLLIFTIILSLTACLGLGAQNDSTQVLAMPQKTVAVDADEQAVSHTSERDYPTAISEVSAKECYIHGNYSEAARIYQTLLDDSPKPTAALLFNLGTSYYQTKQYGKAILMLERAKRLSPKDQDIDNNLNMAYSKIIDNFNPGQPLISYILDSCSRLFGLAWSIAFVFVFAAIFVGGLLIFFIGTSRQRRRISFYIAGAAFFLLILFNIFAWNEYSHYTDHSMAIVQAIQTEVKNKEKHGKTELLLHQGTKVKILEEKDNRIKVQTADRQEGWIDANTVEKINPEE